MTNKKGKCNSKCNSNNKCNSNSKVQQQQQQQVQVQQQVPFGDDKQERQVQKEEAATRAASLSMLG
jgi:hypothetical protein